MPLQNKYDQSCRKHKNDSTFIYLRHLFKRVAREVNFMRILFTLFLSLFTSVLFAQNIKTSIHVTDINYVPLPNATIGLFSKKDSTKTFNRVTDTLGNSIVTLVSGSYRIKVEALGYKTIERNITVGQGQVRFNFPMSVDAKSMEGIVVTARKPLMRQEDDKTIVDPENLATSSTNAYEVIEKIPGLYVDQDGNVMLNNSTPSAVWINGREQKMSSSDIATLLKSLPPNSIEKIEVIRTPSARYDASGGGGIVNIVLKKNVKLGMTGSVNTGMNQGRYGNQFSSFNLNNSDGNLSTNLSINAERHNSYDQSNSRRYFSVDSVLYQKPYNVHPGYSNYIGYSINYKLNDKWEVSSDSRVSYGRSFDEGSNPASINKISTSGIISSNRSQIDYKGTNLNITQGFSSKLKMDSLGSEWTNDISYSYVPNSNQQHILNQLITPVALDMLSNGQINNTSNFFTFQSNLIRKYKKKFTMEAGVKTTNVWFGNNTRYYNQVTGNNVVDARRTNAYHYQEHIHAAYLQGSKTMGSFILKTGVRLENTNMIGHQRVPNDTSFKLNRTDPFPFVYLSKHLMKMGDWEIRAFLVYRRTITRPSYGYLNPAIRVLNPYMYELGNPGLKPQFNQNYEANISVNDRPIFAFGLNDTKDIFSQVIYKSPTNSQLAYQTYDNLGKNKEVYFRLVGAVPPGKKYFFVAGTQYNHNIYNGMYDKLPFNYSRASWSFFTYHQYKAFPNLQFSMHGFMRTGGNYNFYELSNFGSMNLNATRYFLNKKLMFTVSIQDLFFTSNTSSHLKQGSLEAFNKRTSDSRRIGLNLRYNFGIKKKEERNKMDDIFGGN